MPTNYDDQFYLIDPGNPPAVGSALSPLFLTLRDAQNDNFISPMGPGADDRIDGTRITDVWVGDTITINVNGANVSITGTTFYLTDGRTLFTPNDGSTLPNATFVSSTFVTTSTQMPVGLLGPPCFADGTLIRARRGAVRVETLQAGDEVWTMDDGWQPVLWAGRSTGAGLVQFKPAAIGNKRALCVSPQHKMLITGWLAELHFGQPEVLVAAKHLVNGDSIEFKHRGNVGYNHILLPRHHLIKAEGCWSESFYPGAEILKDPKLRREVEAVIGDPGDYGDLVRPSVAGFEALGVHIAA